MLPRILSVAGPLFIYLTLVLLAKGLWQARRHADWPAFALAVGAFVASLALVAPVHRLFFDEDIYISIAGNMSKTPAAQLTLIGAPGNVEASTYYKEPPGWPLLLSLVFVVTGPSENVAFIVARVMFALAVAAVYQLARAFLPTRLQAVTAAVLFAATPVCFFYSVSAGTDLTAALFATLGIWGCVTANAPLAAAGLALAAQTRMELIVLIPVIWFVRKIGPQWKALTAVLVAAEIGHIAWVLSLAPELAKAERVPSAFSSAYLARNLAESLRYLVNPTVFPAAVTLLAVGALVMWFRTRSPNSKLLLGQVLLLLPAYLFFYAGSLELNPRYLIQILAPLSVLAVSVVRRPAWLAALILSVGVAYFRGIETPDFVQTLAADHRLSWEFATKLDPDDIVLSSEPEMFLNRGKAAMNAAFIATSPQRVYEALQHGKKVIYHSGVRSNIPDTREWTADRWVKSNFDLRPLDGHTFFEVLAKKNY